MFSVSLRTLIGTVRGLLLAFCAAMGAWLLVSYVSLPKPALSTSTASTPVPEWPRPASAGDTDWSIFQRRQGTSVAPTASLAGRFRLAGTFYALGDNPETSPRAIIDDLEQGEQYLVREREQTTAFEVVRIGSRDHPQRRGRAGVTA